jgi:8-amino-7-oxononanoate synthase
VSWDRRIAGRLQAIQDADRWRSIRTLDGRLPTTEVGGRPVVSFASNDYLGLGTHPAVAEGAHAAIERWGTGTGASRLVVGSRPVHDELEDELARWKGTDAALLFSSGFAANLGVLSTLADDADVLVVSDELNHASIIDGSRLARGRVAIARHNDVDHVRELLAGHTGPALVVVDAVFSMDGDEAPVRALADACRATGAVLVLDEAHSVLGPTVDPADAAFAGVELVRVGTLSKALGSMGGFVAASRSVIDLLVNAARPFIFSTALSPADAGAALAAIRIVGSPEGEALVAKLRRHVEVVAAGHPSPIVPMIVGEEAAAVAASQKLLDQGLYVPAIRPPTVAAGTSRLRVALSAAHTEEQVDALARALVDLGPTIGG